jgi:hypothetical protein
MDEFRSETQTADASVPWQKPARRGFFSEDNLTIGTGNPTPR